MLFSMFLEMLMGIGAGIAIIVAILTIVGVLTVAFTVGSIYFSRITFSLLVGLVASSQIDIVAGGFLNFLIWAVIGAAITFGLSSFPRSNSAISMFCTILITTIVVSLVGGAAFSIYNNLAKNAADLSVDKTFEILIKALSVIFGIFAYMKQYEKGTTMNPSGMLGVNFDRLVASLVIGFCFVYLTTAWNGNWHTSETMQWIVQIAGTVLAFVADMLFNRRHSA